MVSKYFLLSLDDFHPEKGCGLELDRGPIKYLELLWKEFPELKVTLFLTPDWRYLPQTKITKFFGKFFGFSPFFKSLDKPLYRIDKPEFKKWRSWIIKKIKSKNLQIAIHGLYHIQKYYPYSAEFQNLNYQETLNRISEAEKLLKLAKIPFVKGFKPPGWLYNQNLLKALADMKYKFLAAKGILEFIKKYNLFKIPPTCDIRYTSANALKEIIAKSNFLIFHGHVFNVYHGERIGITNALTEESYQNLKEILSSLSNIEFIFHSEVPKIFRLVHQGT